MLDAVIHVSFLSTIVPNKIKTRKKKTLESKNEIYRRNPTIGSDRLFRQSGKVQFFCCKIPFDNLDMFSIGIDSFSEKFLDNAVPNFRKFRAAVFK